MELQQKSGDTYDYVIIGSGIAGLICAAYLSKKGKSVIVLEKNQQIGGCLQVFSRDKKILDTGVHYIGGLGKDQSLYQLFHFLGIIEELEFCALDEECFDRIIITSSRLQVDLAQGWDRFERKMVEQFPAEREGLQLLCNKAKQMIAKFGPYHLKEPDKEAITIKEMSEGAYEVLENLLSDPVLIGVLGGNSILYGGKRDKTPFYVYALILNSYIEGAYRMVKGGSQIAKALSKVIHRYGGEIRKYCEVTGVDIEQNAIIRVLSKEGLAIEGSQVISAIHPAAFLQLLPAQSVRSTYRSRIEGLINAPALLSVYFTLKPNEIPYFNHNYYVLDSPQDAWNIRSIPDEGWPYNCMVSTGCEEIGQQWCNTINVLAYCDYSVFSTWEDSFNSVVHPSSRGEGYDEVKRQLIDRVTLKLEAIFPDFKSKILDSYCSTALTYRDYLSAPLGTPYGIEKDINNILYTFVSPKTSIKNVVLTGQSTDLHGVYGASISALLTLKHTEEGKDIFGEINQFVNHQKG